MRKRLRTLGLILVWIALGHGSVAAEVAVPTLSGRIVDQAGLIDGTTTARLEARLARLEATTGSQVAVLTIPSLEGDPIEDFSIRVVEAWKLGREGVDDGALFLIVPGDRRMRIEVGYGLEPTLTDAKSRRILDDIVTPMFRAGDMAGGIAAGVEAIAMVAEGSELPAPVKRKGDGEEVHFFVMLVLFILLILFMRFLRGRHDEVWTSDHGWGRRRGRSRGGWIVGGGGFGGGGFGGGGGGFGGFSGGGGSFGGGGASGSW